MGRRELLEMLLADARSLDQNWTNRHSAGVGHKLNALIFFGESVKQRELRILIRIWNLQVEKIACIHALTPLPLVHAQYQDLSNFQLAKMSLRLGLGLVLVEN